MKNLDTMTDDIYRYLNFNEIQSYREAADRAENIPAINIQEIVA